MSPRNSEPGTQDSSGAVDQATLKGGVKPVLPAIDRDGVAVQPLAAPNHSATGAQKDSKVKVLSKNEKKRNKNKLLKEYKNKDSNVRVNANVNVNAKNDKEGTSKPSEDNPGTPLRARLERAAKTGASATPPRAGQAKGVTPLAKSTPKAAASANAEHSKPEVSPKGGENLVDPRKDLVLGKINNVEGKAEHLGGPQKFIDHTVLNLSSLNLSSEGDIEDGDIEDGDKDIE